MKAPRVDPADPVRALPALYLLGMFACIVLVEANFRYSWCANVFLPLYCGALATALAAPANAEESRDS